MKITVGRAALLRILRALPLEARTQVAVRVLNVEVDSGGAVAVLEAGPHTALPDGLRVRWAIPDAAAEGAGHVVVDAKALLKAVAGLAACSVVALQGEDAGRRSATGDSAPAGGFDTMTVMGAGDNGPVVRLRGTWEWGADTVGKGTRPDFAEFDSPEVPGDATAVALEQLARLRGLLPIAGVAPSFLRHIPIEVVDGIPWALATDGHVLMRVPLGGNGGPGQLAPVPTRPGALPAVLAAVLQHIAEDVTVSWRPGWISATWGIGVAASRIDFPWPSKEAACTADHAAYSWRELLVTAPAVDVTVNATELQRAITRASRIVGGNMVVSAAEDGKAARRDPRGRRCYTVTFTARTPQGDLPTVGKADAIHETVRAQGEVGDGVWTDDAAPMFDLSVISRALATLDGWPVEIQHGASPLGPLVLRQTDDGDGGMEVRAIVMPMRRW